MAALLKCADEAASATPPEQPVRVLALVDGHATDGRGGVLLGLLRAARDIDVVAVTSTLPPLALAVLAEQLALLVAAYEDDGETLTALPVLSADLDVLAWLGSVGGLAHLPTAVSQHLRSWLPGTAFVARASGEPVVVPASDEAVAALLAFRPGRGAAVCTSPNGDGEWAHQVALPRLAAEVVVEVDSPIRSGRSERDSGAPDPGKRWWGTSRCVEVVGYALDPLAAVADVAPSRSCTWCGQPGSADVCPICGMTLTAASRT
jgi:hypothetical protein